MKKDLNAALSEWLGEEGGRIGEVAIRRLGDAWMLCHVDDVSSAVLETSTRWEDARAIANYDDKGGYRPLKTAPNLAHGWLLKLGDVAALRFALDYLYPGMLGMWAAQMRGSFSPVNLRDTLNRQTGMYRVTQKITDEQADDLTGRMCNSKNGCLKSILWKIADDRALTTLPPAKFDLSFTPSNSLPLICQEACNLLVAEARKVVKASDPSKPE